MFTVGIGDLHAMDLAAHIHLMEEWNEDTFQWGPAHVILHGYYTRVIQEDGLGGVHVATYITHGEGDIVSLVIYTHKRPQGDEYLYGSLMKHESEMARNRRKAPE